MTDPDAQEDAANVASPTLAHLRTLDRKMDLVLETQARHTERLGRLEREFAEVRRDLTEIRSDIALLKKENKNLSAQSEVLTILHRFDQSEHSQAVPPAPDDR